MQETAQPPFFKNKIVVAVLAALAGVAAALCVKLARIASAEVLVAVALAGAGVFSALGGSLRVYFATGFGVITFIFMLIFRDVAAREWYIILLLAVGIPVAVSLVVTFCVNKISGTSQP